ncbi:hypothetical protein L218DRAFT_482639 [Marasmius fiardii PR-910]|nr:hypothetical protein L218DRAFT_482639 [Marasmius fiardii PR-910]
MLFFITCHILPPLVVTDSGDLAVLPSARFRTRHLVLSADNRSDGSLLRSRLSLTPSSPFHFHQLKRSGLVIAYQRKICEIFALFSAMPIIPPLIVLSDLIAYSGFGRGAWVRPNNAPPLRLAYYCASMNRASNPDLESSFSATQFTMLQIRTICVDTPRASLAF